MSLLPAEDPRWRQLTLGLFSHAPASLASFFAGPNAEALRAVRTWAVDPSAPWCLLLWGPPGCGKSHLLQGAASAVGGPCMYLPLREALRFGPGLLEGLETLDAVCVDDLDVIAGDTAWEEALFALYNSLQANGGRLLFSAAAAPQVLALELPDLRSRLAAALVYHLEPLNDEHKHAALVDAAARRGFHLPDPVASWLLRRLPRDWLELEQALDALDRASLSAGRALTVPFAREVIGLPD